MRSVAGRLFSRRKRAISAGTSAGRDFGDARLGALGLGLERSRRGRPIALAARAG